VLEYDETGLQARRILMVHVFN